MRIDNVNSMNFCGRGPKKQQKAIADVDKILRVYLGLPENMPNSKIKRLAKKAAAKGRGSKFPVNA